jgi:hypothetical protein
MNQPRLLDSHQVVALVLHAAVEPDAWFLRERANRCPGVDPIDRCPIHQNPELVGGTDLAAGSSPFAPVECTALAAGSLLGALVETMSREALVGMEVRDQGRQGRFQVHIGLATNSHTSDVHRYQATNPRTLEVRRYEEMNCRRPEVGRYMVKNRRPWSDKIHPGRLK